MARTVSARDRPSTWMAEVATTPPSSWESLGGDDTVYRTVGNAMSLPVKDGSIHVICTSPPYNVSIPNYASGFDDTEPWPVYVAKARKVAKEMHRVLVDGGRVWLNIQATVPFIPGTPSGRRVNLMGIWLEALSRAGFAYRDIIAWVQDSFDGGCAWGSWQRPSSPNLRGSHEIIILVYKPNPLSGDDAGWKREPPMAFRKWQDKESDDEADPLTAWEELTRNVWKIAPANKRALEWGRVQREGDDRNWPAAYPVELPSRAIRLSTWPQEVVLDPYAGRGTTGWAARRLGRRCVLVDLGYGEPGPY